MTDKQISLALDYLVQREQVRTAMKTLRAAVPDTDERIKLVCYVAEKYKKAINEFS